MIDELGFVPIDQIQNVFSDKLTEIEQDLERQGVPSDPRLIIEWIDDVRQSLMQRARSNVAEYVRKNPVVKVKERVAEKEEKEKAEKRKDWKESAIANRRAAIAECYK